MAETLEASDIAEYIRNTTDVTEFLNLIYDENPQLLRNIALEMARTMPETLENYYSIKPLETR